MLHSSPAFVNFCHFIHAAIAAHSEYSPSCKSSPMPNLYKWLRRYHAFFSCLPFPMLSSLQYASLAWNLSENVILQEYAFTRLGLLAIAIVALYQ
jgi:hypothetical protein